MALRGALNGVFRRVSKSRLIKHTAVYGVGVVIQRAISFVMLPVYTRYLTPSDYGVLELLENTIDVIGTIAGMGVASAVFKFFADADEAGKSEVVGTAAVTQSTMAALVAIIGFLFSPELTHLILGAEQNPFYFRLFFITYFFQSASIIPRMLLRALELPGLFVAVSIGQLVLQLSSNIYFVVYREMRVEGVLYGSLLAKSAVALFVVWFAVRRMGVRFSWIRLRELAIYGNPLVLFSLAAFVFTFSDRFFLQRFWNSAEVGLYTLAYKFAFAMGNFAVGPFALMWQPRRFEVAKRPDAPEVFGRVFVYFNVVVAIVALGIALTAGNVLRVMAANAFWSAERFVPTLLVAQILHYWAQYAAVGVLVAGRTTGLGWSSAVAVIGVLVFNAVLIPPFGANGAAWATLLASAVNFLTVLLFAQRSFHIRYQWIPVAKLYLIAALAWLGFRVAPSGGLLTSLSLAASLWVVVCVLTTLVVFTPRERHDAIEKVRSTLVAAIRRRRRSEGPS